MITDTNGLSPNLICLAPWATTGGADRFFSCPNSAGVDVSVGQRIRFRVSFVGGNDITLFFDGGVSSADSSVTVPVPEFGELALPSATVLMVIFVISYRRRRKLD